MRTKMQMSVGTLPRRRWARGVALGLMLAVLAPLVLAIFASPAHAEEDPDNYSLYQLASNASTYFGEKRSPENDNGDVGEDWGPVTSRPASAGSLLGYADPEFSISDAMGWLFAEVSGSSQTLDYSSLVPSGAGGDVRYDGLLDYAYFGAANADLGLDSMNAGIMGGIMNAVGGSIVWFFYGLAILVSQIFVLIIKMLQIINPFLWFGAAVNAINPTFGNGMTQGHSVPGALQPLSDFIAQWYEVLNSIAWEVLVPLFLGVLLFSLIFFKKMDRGSAVKRFCVRVVFIGVGLPLIGSMYTQVLDRFAEDPVSTAGPTQVVASTYVDFEAWMMNDRLRIPDEASIGWHPDAGHAYSSSQMSVRNTALAINKQSYAGSGAYDELQVGGTSWDADDAYENNAVVSTSASEAESIFATFGMLNRFISGDTITASDFESSIKSRITSDEEPDSDTKKDWFINDETYGDVKKFGEEDDPLPDVHPVIAVKDGTGLTSSNGSGDHNASRTFTSDGLGSTSSHCRDKVHSGSGEPAACNLSPLAAYNYLNTRFDSNAMTFYSSNKATSGFTRETHNSVSQVGTGPARFMYWSNAVVLLGCMVLLGFWYAIGMLVASLKRTFSLVAAVPFATLGAMAAISKVIIYSIAMILEVIVTLFIYQFVSQFLISIPNLLVMPLQAMSDAGVLSTFTLGPALTVFFTFISNLIILGVTFMLLKVRKSVLQAIDEAVTKMVDKFLETNTAPSSGNTGGALPALASGIGAGAGMAVGNKLAGAAGNAPTNSGSSKNSKGPGGSTGPTNAGGTNGPGGPSGGGPALDGPGSGPAALPGGSGGDGNADKVPALIGGGGSDGAAAELGSSGVAGHINVSSSDGGTGVARAMSNGKGMAAQVTQQGGLSNLGVAGPDGRVIPGTAGGFSAPSEGGSTSTTPVRNTAASTNSAVPPKAAPDAASATGAAAGVAGVAAVSTGGANGGANGGGARSGAAPATPTARPRPVQGAGPRPNVAPTAPRTQPAAPAPAAKPVAPASPTGYGRGPQSLPNGTAGPQRRADRVTDARRAAQPAPPPPTRPAPTRPVPAAQPRPAAQSRPAAPAQPPTASTPRTPVPKAGLAAPVKAPTSAPRQTGGTQPSPASQSNPKATPKPRTKPSPRGRKD